MSAARLVQRSAPHPASPTPTLIAGQHRGPRAAPAHGRPAPRRYRAPRAPRSTIVRSTTSAASLSFTVGGGRGSLPGSGRPQAEPLKQAVGFPSPMVAAATATIRRAIRHSTALPSQAVGLCRRGCVRGRNAPSRGVTRGAPLGKVWVWFPARARRPRRGVETKQPETKPTNLASRFRRGPVPPAEDANGALQQSYQRRTIRPSKLHQRTKQAWPGTAFMTGRNCRS